VKRNFEALILALALLSFGPSDAMAAPTAQSVHARSLDSRTQFERYSRVLGSDRFTKFIIDLRSDTLYYIDVNIFRLHADFVFDFLLKQKRTHDTVRRYNLNYERKKPRFILGYITEHTKNSRITFSFWEGDKISPASIARVARRLEKSFYAKDLAFRPDSPAQERVAHAVRRLGIPVVTNSELYKSAPFQALHEGTAVGTLVVVPKGTPYELLSFDRGDIVLLREAYPDISPVAGILTTRASTPLAHVNLRATSWGIPNASYVRAHTAYRRLAGKVVYFEVSSQGHVLRIATPDEIVKHGQRNAPKKVVVPLADTASTQMPMLTHIRASHADVFGAKAANLGEIVTAQMPTVHVPPGFAIPFHYYVRHLKAHHLDEQIARVTRDPSFTADAEWRKRKLAELRAAIRHAPLSKDVLDAVYKRTKLRLGGRGVFVRSSTNAEDLPGFNGAGLYDTVPNVRGKRALGDAIKQVWASVWNYRAVEERSLFGIAHASVYPGVLVQSAVNATAAGVLITKNLYDRDDTSSYTINAKWGLGIRVVEGTNVPEQVVYDTLNEGCRILSRSDDQAMLVFDEDGGIREVKNENKGVILNEIRARDLANAVTTLLPLFPKSQALDIEWLFEGEKIWIVQARPYVQ